MFPYLVHAYYLLYTTSRCVYAFGIYSLYGYLLLVWSLLFVRLLLLAGSLVILFGFLLAFIFATRLLLGQLLFLLLTAKQSILGAGLVDDE